MASIYLKRGTWWARLKGDKAPGKWSDANTHETDRDAALRYAHAAQKAIDKRRGLRPPGALTLREWATTWLERRREAETDWRKERGHMTEHVLPALGGTSLDEIATAQVIALVHDPALVFAVISFDEGWNFACDGEFNGRDNYSEDKALATDEMYERVYGEKPDHGDGEEMVH